ncbi:MAG: UbiE/COQ5 methyltransferase [Chloroflexi bacterium]|nr:UbiE/COQ5 methyltransferase [Chloroflexota bacterium]
MSERPASHADWAAIDATDDPEFFVRFLDSSRVAAIQAAKRDPAAFFSYLDLKPGSSILEVGCGLGDMARALAPLVGAAGRVVGVDNSETMIRLAQQRTSQDDGPITFRRGDIMALDFPDGEFDRARVEQVLQHVAEPGRAVAELARVTRPGGRVVALEPDWDTLVIDAEDLAASQAFSAFNSTCVVRHGRIGRQLSTLFREAGLADVSIVPQGILAGYEATREFVTSNMARAVAAGAIDEGAAHAWLDDLQVRAEDGRYVAAFLMFRVSGVVRA